MISIPSSQPLHGRKPRELSPFVLHAREHATQVWNDMEGRKLIIFGEYS